MVTLDGAGAVVTGGASGIGRATAFELAKRGARVVVADVEAAELAETVELLQEAGAVATGISCDVASLASVEELADASFSFLKHVDVLFNNAGVALGGPILEMTHDDWRWVIDVDLWGAIHGVEAFLPRMVERRTGHIAFTSSFAGLVQNAGLGPYCVAKYGVVALAEVLQRELRSHDIGVSVLCPMRVDTQIGSSQRNRSEAYGGRNPNAEVADQSESNDAMVGSVLTPDEVAALTVDAILDGRLYVLPHAESREPIRRRFGRIDGVFESHLR